MAEIYSKASRVIVWLGEAGHDRGDRALDKIRRIAASVADDTPDYEGLLVKRMVALLRRPWFERIWVLQEAAAARDIVIRCGSAEIDGYAFSVALISMSFNYVYKASPDLRSLLGSVTFLIRGAAFRSRGVATPGRSGQVSLGIRPLGELIDMYHSRKATVCHDKVFALLDMSSDHPDLLADVSPNYDVAWEPLLKRLVGLLLGKQVSVQTWPDTEMAVIRGKGTVLGFVSEVSSHHDMDDRMRTNIDIKRSMTSDQHLGDNRGWNLQPPAKSVQEGDLVCLLRGATKPRLEDGQITEDVALAAAANSWLGDQVMEVLLAQRGDEIKITRAVVVAAAGNLGEERMIRHVLEHKGCDIEITEDVLVAAAGNDYQGKEVMTYLFEEGDEIKITENVLVAAAGNERDGVMQLLLRWRGNELRSQRVFSKRLHETNGEATRVELAEGVTAAAAENLGILMSK
ncbi:hypothetical protein B0T24DRAFT_671423 [Lasiosphaeria ovina]|uniref:Heterokaryon incompatibility domain-containing protein n=1 Tax=Lasiosphaeria ovina TaxID=92902 RepID=A0AAE0MYM4_9PEZI|nr:hypothetical protein B0T24DRAFT_671423 [Lasiosphaeria ovina]